MEENKTAEQLLGEISELNDKLADSEKELQSFRERYGTGDGETDFEEFLKQFPDADAQAVVEGVISSGDFKKGTFTREYVRSLKSKIKALEEENESEEAILKKARANGKITDAIVGDYLRAVSLKRASASPVVVGTPPALPKSKPKSIAEAGLLAGDIFKNS